jgi:hypothetical protein
VLVGGERNVRLDHTVRHAASHRKPGFGQQPEHGVVADQRVGAEFVDAAQVGERPEVHEQQGADAPVVHVVGDGHSELGRSRLLLDPLIARHPDDGPVQQRQQRRVAGSGDRQIRSAICSATRGLMEKNRR